MHIQYYILSVCVSYPFPHYYLKFLFLYSQCSDSNTFVFYFQQFLFQYRVIIFWKCYSLQHFQALRIQDILAPFTVSLYSLARWNLKCPSQFPLFSTQPSENYTLNGKGSLWEWAFWWLMCFLVWGDCHRSPVLFPTQFLAPLELFCGVFSVLTYLVPLNHILGFDIKLYHLYLFSMGSCFLFELCVCVPAYMHVRVHLFVEI